MLAMGDVALGRNLHKLLPEDDLDRQPIVGGGGRYLLVADARIDNRGELAAELDIAAKEASGMSDAALMMAAWERWQLASHDKMLGDFAVGVWDAHEQALTLLRSAFAQKPLFYYIHPRFTAFATMPAGLHSLPIPRRIHFQNAATIAGQFAYLGSATVYEGIRQVRHGHAVRLKGQREEIICLLDLTKVGKFKRTADHAEALRSELDRAVSAQLRRHRGPAAAHLSSGRDSSAVTTSAARVLAAQGQELLAFTGAPGADFRGPAYPGRLADESELAAKTAALHNNVRHLVCRPDSSSTVSLLNTMSAFHHGPLGNIANMHWWAKINEEASRRGCQIMLIGSTGNLSISSGGVQYLRDLLSQDSAGRWLRKALSLGRGSPSAWRSIANATWGPILPRSIHSLALRAVGRGRGASLEAPILRPPYRQQTEAFLDEQWADSRPPRSYFEYRRNLLLLRDNPDKMSLACWGIDPRDPTSDRRLVQLSLSIPADQLVSGPSTRPLFEAAFQDRIPSEVLHSGRRGYQGADWYEQFRKEEVEAAFRTYRRNPIVGELLDLGYIDGLIETWPERDWNQPDVLRKFRNPLLRALALASFIDVYFPD